MGGVVGGRGGIGQRQTYLKGQVSVVPSNKFASDMTKNIMLYSNPSISTVNGSYMFTVLIEAKNKGDLF